MDTAMWRVKVTVSMLSNEPSEAYFRAGELEVHRIPAEHGPALQTLFERDPEYFETSFGTPPGPSEAQSAFVGLPAGKAYEDKFLLGLYRGQSLTGVIDAVRNHPEPGTWTLALLFVEPTIRGQGVGAAVLAAFQEWVADMGCRELRLATSESNDRALRFWRRHGYTVLERQRRTPAPVAIMHRHLRGPA
jgi:GNAT superfamily N-acetyltransferase